MNPNQLTRNHFFADKLTSVLIHSPLLVITTYCLVLSSGAQAFANEPSLISFDLPPTAVAIPVACPGEDGVMFSDASEPVEITLRLSSLIRGGAMPQIDQWMVRCVPRQTSWRVADYSPRTETASEYVGSIQVKASDEESKSFGMAIDAAQGNLVRGHFGVDQGAKQTESLQYERHAPLHAVTAAGTIQRGRGVYYKLRWTANQVLEGEKEFKVTFAVPPGFRAGLLDVSVVAIGRPAKRSALEDTFSQIPVLGKPSGAMRRLGESRFVVAVHAEGDPVAWRAAETITDAEATLRSEAASARATSSARSLSTLLRHVAAKFDSDAVDLHSDWVERLIFESADPYTDPIIRKLPTEVRVSALDYCNARRKLQDLHTRTAQADTAHFQLNEFVRASLAQPAMIQHDD